MVQILLYQLSGLWYDGSATAKVGIESRSAAVEGDTIPLGQRSGDVQRSFIAEQNDRPTYQIRLQRCKGYL